MSNEIEKARETLETLEQAIEGAICANEVGRVDYESYRGALKAYARAVAVRAWQEGRIDGETCGFLEDRLKEMGLGDDE